MSQSRDCKTQILNVVNTVGNMTTMQGAPEPAEMKQAFLARSINCQRDLFMITGITSPFYVFMRYKCTQKYSSEKKVSTSLLMHAMREYAR
jgi:hypothetical protein